MEFTRNKISESFLLKPNLINDKRGCFRRTFCNKYYKEIGLPFEIRQSNISENPHKATLRGFHWQDNSEGKLLTVITGEIFDVLADVRQDSPTYMKWESFRLSAKDGFVLYIPPKCANAWITTQENTIINYFHSDYYNPKFEKGMRYDDQAFNVKWPLKPQMISIKDLSHPNFI